MVNPKAKKPQKGPLTVAKRGEGRSSPAPHESKGSSQPLESMHGPKPSTTANANAASVDQAPSQGKDERQKPQSRKASGVNPRKVSEGLKQLPPDAYRFVRESYLMLDSDGSGSVSRQTMRDMLVSLGIRDAQDSRLKAMLERTGEPITFAGYLAVMGELLADLPSREEMNLMTEAFQTKDGSFDQADMKRALVEEGLSAEEIEAVMRRFSKPTRYGEVFDQEAFANAMSI